MSRPLWRDKGLLLALTAVLAGPWLAACSQTVRGEFSVDACNNGADDDADDLYDCADPDCWVFCPLRPPLMGPVEPPPDLDAQIGDAAMSPPISDSGVITNMPDDDAGRSPPMTDPDDAGMPPPCACSGEEVCVDGQCKPRVIGEYDVRGKGAYVPLYSATDRCYDYDNPTCTTRRPIVCECIPPDPYVVILLDKRVLTRAITPEAYDTASPVWSTSPSERVTLTETSELEFVVYDSDGLGTDTEIFRCSPDLAPLRTGSDSLTCSPSSGMTIPFPRSGSWSIQVEFTKPGAPAE